MSNKIIAPESIPGFLARKADYEVKGYRELAFRQGLGLQHAELNDWIYFQYMNNKAMFDGIYGDGDVLKKGGITLSNSELTNLGPFRIVSDGFPVDVDSQTVAVPKLGTQILGIAVVTEYITDLEDPGLKDPALGTDNYDNGGAARRKMSGRWQLSTEDQEPGTKFYPLYTFINGELYTPDIVDPQQTKINDTLAKLDEAANGSYVSKGTRLLFQDKEMRTPIGDDGLPTGAPDYSVYNFVLEAGTFNVQGYQYSFSSQRSFDLLDMTDRELHQNEPIQFFTPRKKTVVITVNAGAPTDKVTLYTVTIGSKRYQYNSDATPTTAEIIVALAAAINADASAEVTAAAQSSNTQLLLTGKTFEDFPTPFVSGYLTVNVTNTAVSDYYETDFEDVDTVVSVTGQRQVTGEIVTHGAAQGSSDLLSQGPVVSIDSISGYTANTDYKLTGNAVDWSPAGAEPAGGATYTVNYTIQATSNTGVVNSDKKRIQLSGYKNNSTVLVTYYNWLKRRDVVMLGLKGSIYSVTGIPGYVNPSAKSVLSSRDLPIAEVLITKFKDPVIDFVYPPAFTMREIGEMQAKLEELQFNLARSSLQEAVNRSDPLNNKKNFFVDPLLDNSLRDDGLTNTATVAASAIHLAVNPVVVNIRESSKTVIMPYTHALYRSQPKYSKGRRINEFLDLILPTSVVAEVLPTQQRYVAKLETLTPIESIQQIVSEGTEGSQLSSSVTTSASSQPITSTTDITRDDWDKEVLASRAPATTVKFSAEGYLPNEQVKIMYNRTELPGTLVTDISGKLVNVVLNLPAGVGVPGTNTIIAYGRETKLQASVQFQVIPQQRLEISPQRSTVSITIPPPPQPEPIIIEIIRPVVVQNPWGNDGGGNDGGRDGGADPLAQTVMPGRDLYFTKVEVVFEALPTTPVTMLYGPTTDSGVPDNGRIKSAASKLVNQIGRGTKITFEPPSPAYTESQVNHAFTMVNHDSAAQLRVAEIGQIDLATQTRITTNPYLEGVLMNSSNQMTWSPIQAEDMQFWFYRAKFDTSAAYTFEVGQVNLATIGQSNVTDLMLMAGVKTHATSTLQLAIELTGRVVNGVPETHIVEPYRNITIAPYSGIIKIKAIMRTKDEYLSPELDSTVSLMIGKVASTGIYTTREFEVSGDLIRFYLECYEPASSSVAVSFQQGNNFTTVTRDTNYSVAKGNGFNEYRYSFSTPLPGLNVTRLRIQLNGNDPTRRPMARAPRVYVADTTTNL